MVCMKDPDPDAMKNSLKIVNKQINSYKYYGTCIYVNISLNINYNNDYALIEHSSHAFDFFDAHLNAHSFQTRQRHSYII